MAESLYNFFSLETTVILLCVRTELGRRKKRICHATARLPDRPGLFTRDFQSRFLTKP
jgi:hypothetical protein